MTQDASCGLKGLDKKYVTISTVCPSTIAFSNEKFLDD